MKQIGTALLSLLLLLCLVACGTNELPETVTTEAPPPEPAQILVSDLGKYEVVRPETVTGSFNNTTLPLRDALKEKFGITTYKDDFFKENDPAYAMGEYEILIGATNRPESQTFLVSLKRDDWGYTMIGKKIVIAGATDEGTAKALEAFLTDVVNREAMGEVFFTPDMAFAHRETYAIDSLTIDSVSIGAFSIVYPAKSEAGEKELAQTLADRIASEVGYVITPVSDKREKTEHEILIGMTNRTSEAARAAFEGDHHALQATIAYEDGTLSLLGITKTALSLGIESLCGKIDAGQGKNLSLSYAEKQVFTYDDTTLSAMSFNLWVSEQTEARVDRVLTMIRTYSPDTFGVQEANPSWMDHLQTAFGDEYICVGLPRSEGSETSAVFFKKDLFTLIESDTKWLSDTPDVESKYPDSAYPRIFTYTLLQKRSSGEQFLVVNTHFDHKGKEARVLQAKALVQFLAGWDCPILLSGDFNCNSKSEPYAVITGAGYADSCQIAENQINNPPTFTSFGTKSSYLDYIFVRDLTVKSYRVCDEKINGDWASDHHPVLIEYALSKESV